MKIKYNINADFEINKNKIKTDGMLNDILLFEIIERIENTSKVNGKIDEVTLEFLKIDRTSLDEFKNVNLILIKNLKNKLDFLINHKQ